MRADNRAEKRGRKQPIDTPDKFASQVLSVYDTNDFSIREQVRILSKDLYRKAKLYLEDIVIEDERLAQAACIACRFIVGNIVPTPSNDMNYLLYKHEFEPQLKKKYPEKFIQYN